MACLRKLLTSKGISIINNSIFNPLISRNIVPSIRYISTTKSNCDLLDFFDDKKNWGATEIKTGRAWSKEELRLKSNHDLHKLWYVLLKERNMLYTMEEECNNQVRLFPNPERIDKVADSMENLETVVSERNKAYYMLETGENGERPVEEIEGHFGIPTEYKATEHLIPKEYNVEFLEKHKFYHSGKDVLEFRRKFRERESEKKQKEQTREFNHVVKLLARFPEMDMDALKQKHPTVDIEKAKKHPKSRGHFVAK